MRGALKFVIGTCLLAILPGLASALPYERCFELASQKHGVPFDMLVGVARVESNFNADARSSAGAHGIMQIRWPVTARHLGVRRVSELYNPCTNIEVGADYLSELLARYNGNHHLALAAYNYGPTRLSVEKDIPPGVWRYVHKVLGSDSRRPYSRSRESSETPRAKQTSMTLHLFSSRHIAERYIRALKRVLPSTNLILGRNNAGGYVVSADVSRASASDRNLLARLYPSGAWL